MIITVPPIESYEAPEGTYQAKCIQAREIDKNTPQGKQKFFRIIWELQYPNQDNIIYMVGKNYDPNLQPGSQLRNDLKSWFAHDLQPGKFDTQQLPGKVATITVSHIHNDNHDKAFRWVSEVKPPNSNTAQNTGESVQ